MRRILILCAAVVLIMLSACGDHNTYEKNNSAVDSVTTSEVTNELTSSDSVNGAPTEVQSAIAITDSEIANIIEKEIKEKERQDLEELAKQNAPSKLEPMYPDEHYHMVGAPPHDNWLYGELRANTKDLIDFINNTDEHTYINGYYWSFFRATRDIGYVLKPKFDGIELDNMIAVQQAYGIGINFEEDYCGPSYSYSLDIEDYKHRVFIHPLKKNWVEDVKDRPFLYEYGKKYHDYDFSEAAKNGWTKHKIQGGQYTVYKGRYSQIHWAYDDYLIRIVFRFSEDIDTVLDTAEKLTFEKVPLKQPAE